MGLLGQQIISARKQLNRVLWQGPGGTGPLGGITFSLLSRFLTCRERFRLYAVVGLRPAPRFNHLLEFGSMWHAAEEEQGAKEQGKGPEWFRENGLTAYARKICLKYPNQQGDVDKWYRIIKLQFPIYLDYWSRNRIKRPTKRLLSEQVFDVPYLLPSGRKVRLRGKWDGINLVQEEDGTERLHIFETKTKGEIEALDIRRQLGFDLQTMFYIVALWERLQTDTSSNSLLGRDHGQVCGIDYNVIRRPLSGGKGAIRQHQPSKKNPQGESLEEYMSRLEQIIREAEGGSAGNEEWELPPYEHYFFKRWSVTLRDGDINRFKDRTLDPILEQLCDWYEWVSFITERGGSVWDNDVSFGARPDKDNNGSHSSAIHWQHPFGVRNVLDEGGASDVDDYLVTGSETGLRRFDTLFDELQ